MKHTVLEGPLRDAQTPFDSYMQARGFWGSFSFTLCCLVTIADHPSLLVCGRMAPAGWRCGTALARAFGDSSYLCCSTALLFPCFKAAPRL